MRTNILFRRTYTAALSVIVALCGMPTSAQDYVEDIRGEGNPLSLSTAKGDVFLRFNTSDGSIKLGLFRVYHLKTSVVDANGKGAFDPSQPGCPAALEKIQVMLLKGEKIAPASYSTCYAAKATTANFQDFGWGAYVKGKPTDGAATLFSGGELSLGTRLSGYLMYRRTKIKNDIFKYSLMIAPSVAWQENAYDLATRMTSGLYQFTDTSLSSLDVGLSTTVRFFIGPADKDGVKKTECFLGVSVTQAQPTTYDDLNKVTLTQTSSRTDSIDGNAVVTTTEVKSKTAYAVGPVQRLDETRIRLNMAILPDLLDRRIAFNFYPSLNLREEQLARTDLGFSINLLEKGNKLLSIGGATFELGDITNTGNSDKPFFSRAFRFGLNVGLNIEGLFAKK